MKLLGKVAVVTGASSGIGKSIALMYAKEGASVVAVARRKERLDEIVEMSKEYKGSILAFQGDISKKEDNEKMVDIAVNSFGRIDILVNNAGIMDSMEPISELDDDTWFHLFNVNLNGPFYAMKKAINYMLEQGSGNIINVTSIGGLFGGRAGAGYTSSKYALNGLTKNIAFMYANKGIRCNAICPGGVKTEIAGTIEHFNQFGTGRTGTGSALIPRLGEAEEIASVAVFLACEDSSFVNGAEIIADAGWSAY